MRFIDIQTGGQCSVVSRPKNQDKKISHSPKPKSFPVHRILNNMNFDMGGDEDEAKNVQHLQKAESEEPEASSSVLNDTEGDSSDIPYSL